MSKAMCEGCWFDLRGNCVAPNVTPESKIQSEMAGVCRSAAIVENPDGPRIAGKKIKRGLDWFFEAYIKRYVT